MNTPQDVATLRRSVDSLRRQARFLGAISVGMALLAGLSAMRAGPADLTLEAHSIKLYDDAGQVYAAFGENENGRGRGLTMYAADGTKYAVLGPTKLGYGLRLFAADGTMLTELDVTRVHEPNVPRFTMHDERGVPRIGIIYERWPRFILLDEQQNGRMEIYAHEDRAGIGLKDGQEQLQAGIVVTGSEGSVYINGTDSFEGWRAPRARIEPDNDDERIDDTLD